MDNNSDKEIDLYVVIKNTLKFIIKNKWIVLTSILIGVLIAILQIKNNPKVYTNYYQSYFFVQSSFITEEVIHTLVNNLAYTYEDLDTKIYDAQLIKSIKEIKPVKELSIDGLRSNIRVIIDIAEPQDLNALIKLVKTNIEATEYYQLRHGLESKQYQQILALINTQLDSLGIDVNSTNIKNKLEEKSNNPEHFLAYIALIEKKQELENKLVFLDKALEFVPVEPVNKPINTTNKKVLTILGFSFLMFIVGIILSALMTFFKKVKS
jgi:hypothetical protein